MAWPFSLFRRSAPQAQTRGLEAASPRRPWGAPVSEGFGNPTILAGLDNVRRKSRHATINNPWMANGVGAHVSATVGTGITPTSLVPDTAARSAIGASYSRWTDVADSDGTTDFYGLQEIAFRELVVAGEALCLLLTGPDGGLRLRLLPADALDLSLTRELGGGARIVAGVEMDAAGRRVAFHIRPDAGASPFVSLAPPVRVPAEDVCHVMRPLQPGQVRGLPWAASILLALNEFDQLAGALLVGAKVAAMHAGFITDMNTTGGIPYEGAQNGGVLTGGLEPGTLKILPSGMDIKFSSPQQQNSAIDQSKLTLRSIAAGLGVPEYLLTGDLSQANYSSLRAALVEFRRRVEQVQHHVLVPQLLGPIWRRFLTLEIISGRLQAPGFERDPASWLAVEWYPPPMPWIDPLKDAEAESALIQAGLKSRRQAVAERGYDIETVDAEIAADRAREKALGLSFTAPPATLPVGVPT